MNDSQIKVPCASGMSAVGQFEANKEFQKGASGSKLQRYQRKSWHHVRVDPSLNAEVITTFFSSQGENDCIDKFLEADISYRDLASLTNTDLELLGFKSTRQREDLLNFFKQLPNQDPSYKAICELPDAQKYNSQILNYATTHLYNMRRAMAAANYKLRIMPPDDVLVGEKSFASHFVLEALDKLKDAVDEIDKELVEIEQLIKDDIQQKKYKQNATKHSANIVLTARGWIVLSSVATGALAILWFWKLNRMV